MNHWRQHKAIIITIIGAVFIILVLWWIRKIVNKNQGLVMAIVTTVLVVTTIYYSWLNKRLLEITDLPKIILDIRPWRRYEQQHMFVIENIGTGIAFDIQLKVLGNQPFMLNPNLSLMDTPCAKISSMPPKQDYKTLIESEEWGPEKRKTLYKIEVSYTNSQGKKFSDEFNLSIDASRYHLQDDLVAEFLREIAIHTKEIANQSPDTQTTDGSTPSVQDQIEKQRREKEKIKSSSSPST